MLFLTNNNNPQFASSLPLYPPPFFITPTLKKTCYIHFICSWLFRIVPRVAVPLICLHFKFIQLCSYLTEATFNAFQNACNPFLICFSVHHSYISGQKHLSLARYLISQWWCLWVALWMDKCSLQLAFDSSAFIYSFQICQWLFLAIHCQRHEY